MNSTMKNLKSRNNKPKISSIPVPKKYKSKGFNTQIISTGEKAPLNLLEIYSNENEKAFIFKHIKYNNDKNVDNVYYKLGTIRINLLSNYISTFLSVMSDYQTIFNQPIIRSIQKYEDGIMMKKQLFNIKKYIYNFIKKLPEKKINKEIKEYLIYLENEIEKGKKLGIDSDNYEINYLFNFFPKGIEIMFDYDIIECVYYNSKKNNKISGKALIPSPELYFKLDSDKVSIKLFDFEFEVEDLDDIKNVMSIIWKIIQEKIQVAKLFIEPCLSQARLDLEKMEKEKENKEKILKSKLYLIENNMNKNKNNNNNNSLNLSKNKNDTNKIKHDSDISKKNLTFTNNNINSNIMKNIQNHFNLNKMKNKQKEDKKNNKGKNPLKEENSEDDEKKKNNQNEDISETRNLNDSNIENSKETENINNYAKNDDNSDLMNLSEGIK